jgi:hypothetical protein
MVLKGQRRKATNGEQERLQRIASAGQAQVTPTGGIESSAYQLGQAMNAIEQHIGRVAGQYNVKTHDILDELYRRIEGRHR